MIKARPRESDNDLSPHMQLFMQNSSGPLSADSRKKKLKFALILASIALVCTVLVAGTGIVSFQSKFKERFPNPDHARVPDLEFF